MDIEAELVPLIQEETGFKTATRYPDPRPDQFIQLRRQGGSKALSRANRSSVFRDKPLLDLYISGLDEDDAFQASRKVSAFMLRLPETQPLSETVYDVSEVIDTWTDDTLDGVFIAPRVWLSYNLNVRYQ